MKIVDISLIKKYLDGEELGNYSEEELENDRDFMMHAIKYSNDPKIYDWCSDELKKDYDFVKYLVLKFKDNYNFIKKVANYFLENNNDGLKRRELNIIMSELLPDDIDYNLVSLTQYKIETLLNERTKMEYPEVEDEMGYGFSVICDEFGSSDIILHNYAKRIIDDIIENNKINWEKLLHKEFNTAQEVENIGIRNYIIKFLMGYDLVLSSYVQNHLDLISDIERKIKVVLMNWNTYAGKKERERYNRMLGMVEDYLDLIDSPIHVEMIYYVARELGIKDKVYYYEFLYNASKEFAKEIGTLDDFEKELELDYDEIAEEIATNEDYKEIYFNVKRIMVNQLYADNPEEDLYSIIWKDEKIKSDKPMKRILRLFPKDEK